jgi:hypothetical protein
VGNLIRWQLQEELECPQSGLLIAYLQCDLLCRPNLGQALTIKVALVNDTGRRGFTRLSNQRILRHNDRVWRHTLLRQISISKPKESNMPNEKNDRVLTRLGARELTSDELAQVSAGFGGTGCQTTGGPLTHQDINCDCPDC